MDAPKPTILIVDDERFFINVLVDLLKPMYRIVVALSGEQAIERTLSKTPPHLILLDIVMPGMDGYEVCERLKLDNKSHNIPIIFLTNKNDVVDETRGFQLGAIDYITKPISPPTVIARVNTHLTLERTRKELNSYTRQLEETIAARTQDLTQEILDRKKVEEQLDRLSNYDPLTSLPNERLFKQQLLQLLKHCRRNKNTRITLLTIGVGRLLQLNETRGKYYANALFKQLTFRLCQCIRESDTIGRLGKDKFAISLLESGDKNVVSIVTEKISSILLQPFYVDKNNFRIDAHIGVAQFPDDCDSVDSLIRAAEIAMCQIKSDDHHGVSFYSKTGNQVQSPQLPVDVELEDAFVDDQLMLHYQPIFETRSQKMVCADVSVRWQHPRLGLLQPDYFLPIAEESDLILTVIEWVLRRACTNFRKWRKLGLDDFCISMNISSPQYYYNENCISSIANILEETSMPPESLYLCVSESVFIETPEATTKKLMKLKDYGVRLAIDNFGIGYSSLSFIGKFPVDMLKIHRSVIAEYNTDAQSANIIEAMVTMAHILGLTVTAKGVETNEQMKCLTSFNCEYMQGGLSGTPMTENEFERFCMSRGLLQSSGN